MVRPYNISQNLSSVTPLWGSTPSVIMPTPPTLSLDERAFYTTKAWLYERFSGYPEVNTQIINPWTYDPQWRLEEREVIRDAEAMIRASGQRVPVPGAKPAPKPLPPTPQPLPGFQEPFFDDPTMTRRLIGRDSFEDMLSQPPGSELTRPGALLETVLDLADDLTEDDFKDTFDAAKDWNILLKKHGTPWPGLPSHNPRLTATSKDPIVYLNWPERQIHVRTLNPTRSSIYPPGENDTYINGPEAYATPYALPAIIFAIGAAAVVASETFMAYGLALKIIIALYEFAGLEPPSQLETMADVMVILSGLLSLMSLVRLLPAGLITAMGFNKFAILGALYGIGSGIVIWGYVKTDWVEVWEIVDECVDSGGNRIVCTAEVIGKEIISWGVEAGEIVIYKVKEIAEDVAKGIGKALGPILIVGGAALVLVMAVKPKVGIRM